MKHHYTLLLRHMVEACRILRSLSSRPRSQRVLDFPVNVAALAIHGLINRLKTAHTIIFENFRLFEG